MKIKVLLLIMISIGIEQAPAETVAKQGKQKISSGENTDLINEAKEVLRKKVLSLIKHTQQLRHVLNAINSTATAESKADEVKSLILSIDSLRKTSDAEKHLERNLRKNASAEDMLVLRDFYKQLDDQYEKEHDQLINLIENLRKNDFYNSKKLKEAMTFLKG